MKFIGVPELLDTLPTFELFWAGYGNRPLEQQIDGWAEAYGTAWPELFAKQVDDYRAEGLDWKQVARHRVFPFLGERLQAMQVAHDNLKEKCSEIYLKAQAALGLDFDILFVIYVGTGSGAGWATTYQSRPAVLFGLENIAEEGWSSSGVIAGLIAHEIGHLLHAEWRRRANLDAGAGPWWQLYSEGFAQRCEQRTQGGETWHMAQGQVGNWLEWCQANRASLAIRFIELAETGGDIRPFSAPGLTFPDGSSAATTWGMRLSAGWKKTRACPKLPCCRMWIGK
jgi:hypothetical protein